GRGRRTARTVDRTAQVVDDDLGPAAGQFKGVLTAKAAAGAGDDRDFAVEADVRHGSLPGLEFRRGLCGAGEGTSTGSLGRGYDSNACCASPPHPPIPRERNVLALSHLPLGREAG